MSNGPLKKFPDIRYKSNHPLESGTFHKILEDSNCLTENTGWPPIHFANETSILPSYLKTNSYGEYIFDWAWAEFYHRYQIPYYPKLLHGIPFTPVNSKKILGEFSEDLIYKAFDYYQNNTFISGEHYLFSDPEVGKSLENLGFVEMKTLQYHWQRNHGEELLENFDHFLDVLKPGRRKMIKKERKKIKESKLVINKHLNSFSPDLLTQIYELYLSTIDKKFSQAYLSKNFFLELGDKLKDNLFVLTANLDEKIIAMSLFFYGEDSLYGRYWGIKPEYDNQFPGLHFEMCYYQGMDFCFEHKINLFEAGAQGEHKLWRGFKPVEILSHHHLRIPQLFKAIEQYIQEMNFQNATNLKHAQNLLPFKS